VKLEDADRIVDGLIARRMSSYQVKGLGQGSVPSKTCTPGMATRGHAQPAAKCKARRKTTCTAKHGPRYSPPAHPFTRTSPATPFLMLQSGMDSVRNLTGSPIAGLDPHELLDVRWAGGRLPRAGLCRSL
jgi:hypothetical protein